MEHAERILFIDDDAPVRLAFKRSLRGRGLAIDLASGAEEARQLMAANTYGVIATDYRMPKVNGLELVEEMQREQPDATYILVSGECDLDLALQAVNEHHISYVICKPWDTEELATVLKRSLEAYWERAGQRQLQENMVQSSRALEQQKARFAEAVAQAEAALTDALIASLELRGHETENHCRRVAAYALMIAQEMGIRGRMLNSIERGALLHDVGKIGIPDALLLKKGPLTPEEWKVMKTHTQIGAQLLDGFESMAGARQVVAQHHERWDGTGYPASLEGEQICLGARIFAVADTLDALLSERPYRPSYDEAYAVAEIKRCSGTQFDPQVVEAFLRIPSEDIRKVRERFVDGQPSSVRPAA